MVTAPRKSRVWTIPLLRAPLCHWTLRLGLFLLLTLIGTRYGFPSNPFRREWELCLQYLAAETLYGGQPFCVQTPLFFSLLSALRGITPDLAFVPLLVVLQALFSGGTLLVLNAFLKRQGGYDHFWVLLLPYFFLIHRPLLGDLASAMGVFSFSLALYFLLRSQPKRWSAGIALAIAVLSKTSLLVPMVVLLCMALWPMVVSFISRPHRGMFLEFLPLIVPTATATLVFWWWFPNLPYYTVLAATKVTSHTFADGVRQVLWTNLQTLNFLNFATYGILLSAFILVFLRPSALTIGAAVCLFTLFAAANAHMEEGFIRFLIPGYLLVLAAWCRAYPLGNPRRRLIFTTVALLLISPIAVVWGYDLERTALQRLTDYPLSLIPEQRGPILAEGESIAQYRDFLATYYPYSLDRLEILFTPYVIDPGYIPGLTHYGMVLNLSQWTNAITTPGRKHFYLPEAAREENVEKLMRIRNGTYDLIIVGPPYWEFSWAYVRSSRSADANAARLSDYCAVQVPHLKYFDAGNSTKVELLLFRNASDCTAMRQAMAEYYAAHFAEICRADRSLSDFIYHTVLPANAIHVNGTCANTGNFLERYQLVRKFDTYPWPAPMPYPIP